jgi:hypothetical protein
MPARQAIVDWPRQSLSLQCRKAENSRLTRLVKGQSMARTPLAGSVAGYFKAILKANPELLDGRSNDELLLRWLKDHPGDKVIPDNIKASLANVKSILRKRKRKKPGRKKATAFESSPAVTAAAQVAPKTSTGGFVQLEEQIDECLTSARSLSNERLANVIALLRKARNEVVWKLGE